MTWWVLNYLDNDRTQPSLTALAATNHPAHLFMHWATWEPARRPIYRWVRGKRLFCGWKYIWDTPNLVEQAQSLDTFEHTFTTTPVEPHDHIWYYLFSSKTLYERYCQSPLIHVPPPEIEMASARIFRSTNQEIPFGTATPVSFDSVLWDDYNFFDPAQPTRLTIPAGALYHLGAHSHWLILANTGIRIRIRLNGTTYIAGHSFYCNNPTWADVDISLGTQMRFQPDDYLELIAYCTLLAGTTLESIANYSPHFWLRLVGAYPS